MNIEYEKKFGNNIRNIREKKKMTQDTLSAKLQLSGCDITRSAVAKIEVGQRHVYPDEIKLIKEILNTTYDELFYFQIKNKATNGRPYDVEKITYLTKHIKKQAQPNGCACFIKGKL